MCLATIGVTATAEEVSTLDVRCHEAESVDAQCVGTIRQPAVAGARIHAQRTTALPERVVSQAARQLARGESSRHPMRLPLRKQIVGDLAAAARKKYSRA